MLDPRRMISHGNTTLAVKTLKMCVMAKPLLNGVYQALPIALAKLQRPNITLHVTITILAKIAGLVYITST
jgi:hypothetical protein